MRTHAALTLAALAFTLAGAATAAPAAPATAKFEPSMVVEGTPLLLNGVGTRYKAIFKVYDMGLYTPMKVKTPEELLAVSGPVRLQFVAQRELPSTDLGLMFIKSMSENTPRDRVQRHTVSSGRLIEIFSSRSKLVAGDSFAMEFQPGKGTQFYIQDKPQGGPVGDAEFFAMILRIWMGPSPADSLLKDALLGIERRHAGAP